MRHSKRNGIILITVLGLLALSGMAAAQPEEENTAFSYGYDQARQLLLFGWSGGEDREDCELGDEPVTVDYDDLPNGLVVEDCELTAVEVSGPNGQVNHGMFMKAFNQAYQGVGRGCLVRHLAGSALGQGDHQIRVPDADEVELEDVEGEVDLDFITVLTRCRHANGNGNANGNGSGNGNGNGNGSGIANGNGNGVGDASEARGKPESPGNSGSAPGRNK